MNHTLRYVPIPASFYQANRDKLASRLPAGALVIVHANDIYPTNADGTLAHHQNANLFYLTGIDQEETILIMHIGENGTHEDILLLRETNEKIVIWEGARLTEDAATALSGIADVRWTDEYNALLAELVPAADSVWLETDNHPRRFTYVQTRNERMAAALRASYPDVRVESIYPLLAGMRLVKTPEELVQLRRACEITGAGFAEILPRVKPGMGEWEIEAELSAAYIRRRARKFSFLPIIASGADTCVLHYISNHKEVEDGELILLDIGAEYGGYAGDMTRTIPANGKFTPRQKEVYEAVLRVQRYAMSIMRPGLEKAEYERLVRVRMAEEMVQLGLLTREEVDQAPENPLCVRKYYMHGTSHSLGLDVHDVGSDTKCFAEGQVWTVEPGIYVPAEKIGIRLETDVLITADGVEDLIPNAPIEPADIETAMAGR